MVIYDSVPAFILIAPYRIKNGIAAYDPVLMICEIFEQFVFFVGKIDLCAADSDLHAVRIDPDISDGYGFIYHSAFFSV